MITLTVTKRSVVDRSGSSTTAVHTFRSQDGSGRVVDVESNEEWKAPHLAKAIVTLITGRDHSKLLESIRVLDSKGEQVFYLEKL